MGDLALVMSLAGRVLLALAAVLILNPNVWPRRFGGAR